MTEPADETTVQSIRHRLIYTKHRDWALFGLVVLILGIQIWLAMRLADESEQNQQARSTAVGLAAQVQAECDDPDVGVDLAICRTADEIVEDPDNPEAPTIPEQGEPGPVGRPGKDAPPPDPGLLRQFVDEWLAANLPPVLQGPPGEDGEDGTDGADGADGAPGPTCPNGATPIQWHYPGTANLGLPEDDYLICPAG